MGVVAPMARVVGPEDTIIGGETIPVGVRRPSDALTSYSSSKIDNGRDVELLCASQSRNIPRTARFPTREVGAGR